MTTGPNGKLWMDMIQVKVSNFPLDYHMHSWPVAQVLPYLLDKKSEGSFDLLNAFMEWAFFEQDKILAQSGMSHDDFVTTMLPEMISGSFDEIPFDDIYDLYDRDTDVHNSEMKTRAIWKYGAAKGVSGTPTAFVNGVQLDSFPAGTDKWLAIFNDIYSN